MKTIYKAVAFVCGLGLVAVSGVAKAQPTAPVTGERTSIGQMEAVKKSFMLQVLASSVAMNGSFRPRPDIAALEPKLRTSVLELGPDAKIEAWPNRLLVSYQSDRYATHLRDQSGKISQEGADKFPADFGEFRLEVTLANDGEFYRSDTRPQIQAETFGTTLRARYDLRQMESRNEEDASGERFALVAYDCLARAGFAKSRFPGGDLKAKPATLTRREMAELVVAMHQGEKYTLNPALNQDLTMAVGYLQSSFAAEAFELANQLKANRPEMEGQRWQAPDEYLTLEFSYGKGVSPVLVEKLKAVIAEYAAGERGKVANEDRTR